MQLQETNKSNGERSETRSGDTHENEEMAVEEWSDTEESLDTVDKKSAAQVKINVANSMQSIGFLDEKRVISHEHGERKMQIWGVEDGTEVRPTVTAGDVIRGIAVSKDGEWIANGTESGRVAIWNALNRKKVVEFKGHSDWVFAMDFSADKTRIATGSDDKTVKVWFLPTGKRLLGPYKHNNWLAAVKFSPDGQFLATATWLHESVRIYRENRILFDIPIQVPWAYNQTLVWAGDNKKLFALSNSGKISCLDVTTGSTLSTWRIHDSTHPVCIALSSNGAYIAAAAKSSISFWDTLTRQQVGPVIDESHSISSMAISASHRVATAGDTSITIRDLCNIIPSSYHDNIHKFSTVNPQDISRVQSLRAHSHARKKSSTFLNTFSSVHPDPRLADSCTSGARIAHLEKTVLELQDQLAISQRSADRLTRIIWAHEQRHISEALYAQGRICDAARSLLEIVSNVREDIKDNGAMSEWREEFQQRCVTTLEKIGDEASRANKPDGAVEAYSTAISLSPSNTNSLLIKWARITIAQGMVCDPLSAADKSNLVDFGVYRAFCDVLEGDGRVMDAVECFQKMKVDSRYNPSTAPDEQAQWECDFQQRCIQKLEKLGDIAAGSNEHATAIAYYAYGLAVCPTNRNYIVIKCCEVRSRWLEYELAEANKSIASDPSSYKGYERKHGALHRMGRFREAFEALETMLSRIDGSHDLNIRKLRQRYADATPAIRHVIQETIRHMPRILINTGTGRLYDKVGQAQMFEGCTAFYQLRSSMTTRVDKERVWREVKKYYRYVMLSHRWDGDEPLFQAVGNTPVYDLGRTSTNLKLQTFCRLAQSLGFQWAWSDTCCIDKSNNVVLQESLVAMFTWYRGSSLTIIYLCGVFSESHKPGFLRDSVWNTRAWTYQEYVAAEAVQFYTEDWKPYLGLTIYNHKESSQVILEMQQATGALSRELGILRPGLDRVRDKLYVASRRRTTIVEDAAYSLYGIFNAAIPIIYGEGNRAIGRLLEHVLMGSGDVTILAWTGRAGSYNSCLPVDLTVYEQLEPPHVPSPIEPAEMDRLVVALGSSLYDLSEAITLHTRLNDLPSPFLTSSRLHIHGIVFSVTEFVRTTLGSVDTDDSVGLGLHVYRVTTAMLGNVTFQSTDDLSGIAGLVLFHPWISPLLDQDYALGVDPFVRALRLVARLRQPFGALLLAPLSRVQYRRVAADSLITVRIQEEATLSELMEGIHAVDVQ